METKSDNYIVISLIIVILSVLSFWVYCINESDIDFCQSGYNKINNVAVVVKNKIDKGYRGQVEYIEGEVEKRLSEKDGWRKMERSDIIKTGTEVRTFNDSKAIISFDDGSTVRIDSNTIIKFESKKNKIEIEFQKGIMFSKVTKNNEREYSVKMNDYIVVALGTEFNVVTDLKKESEVMVLESEVEIKNKNGDLIEKIETGKKAIISKEKVKKFNISKTDLKKEFIVWNIEKNKEINENNKNKNDKDEEKVEVKTEIKKEKIVSKDEFKIFLTAKRDSKKVRLSWNVSGGKSEKGYKVIMSKEENPVYPGDKYKYIPKYNDTDTVWKDDLKFGKTYHFRVCEYLGGKCGVYSNDVKISL